MEDIETSQRSDAVQSARQQGTFKGTQEQLSDGSMDGYISQASSIEDIPSDNALEQPLEEFVNESMDGYTSESSNMSDIHTESSAPTLEDVLGEEDAEKLRLCMWYEKEARQRNMLILSLLDNMCKLLVQCCYGRCYKVGGVGGGNLYAFWLRTKVEAERVKAQLELLTAKLDEFLEKLREQGVSIDG